MRRPLHLRSIAELAPEIAARRVTCLELTEACLERIEAENDRLNAFITVLAEGARAQARALDREIGERGVRGPLHGIPVSLKDLIDLADVPTTGASRLLAGHVARTDAVVTARLRQAGCVFVGKCNLHEVAFGTTSEDSAYGPVHNPWDSTRSAGGSSGGSAAAVVAGMGCASVGTDTGGSIRIPAAACGCVGLKPGYGELSCHGIIPLSRSLDHVGPLARSVADARLLYDAMLGGFESERKRPASSSRLDQNPSVSRTSGLTLGLLRPYFMDALDPAVRAGLDAALAALTRDGAQIVERRVPHAGDTATVYLHLQLPEASAYHAAALERDPGAYTPNVRLRLQLGRYVRAEDYVRAQQGAAVLRDEVDSALDGCAALLLPTLPIVAPVLGAESLDIDGAPHPVRALMLRLTQLFDITGHPAISIPCGRSASGLPLGLQLVGRRGDTHALLDAAETVEKVLLEGV
jgi:aspartyl-tRNA(Asn)/glutamyl-tRNA(Gln) amidotransferase subunit A